jgi:hypothetical protein
MKTGRDATRPGLYISECCLSEITFLKGQMFTRCPACSALTVWEFVEPKPERQTGVRNDEPPILPAAQVDIANRFMNQR